MNCPKCGTGNAIGARFCMQCGSPLVAGVAGPAGAPSPQAGPAYAGFWIRVAAVLIDAVLLAIAQQPLNAAFSAFMPKPPNFHGGPDLGALFEWLSGASSYFIAGGVAGMFVAWLYYGFFESSSKQGSPGKMALGLKVTDLDGRRISFGRASVRYAASILSALLAYGGYLMGAFTQKKQTLHDILVGTVVIREK